MDGLSSLFVAVDVALLVIMVQIIHYLCPLCLLTYLINLGLLVASVAALGQRWRDAVRQIPAVLEAWRPMRRDAVVWLFWGVVLIGFLGSFAVSATGTFMIQGPPGAMRKQLTQFISQQHRVQADISRDPTIGAAHPAIQIVEFSDFLCPSCQRAAQFNPIILAGHRQDASFTYKHFPLDMECNTTIKHTAHPNACQIAAASECAHEQGKFWAFHEAVFEKGSQYHVAEFGRDAARLGLNVEAFQACLSAGRGMDAVKQDVAEGARLGVSTTPTYIVNGVIIVGVLTPSTFEELLQALQGRSTP